MEIALINQTDEKIFDFTNAMNDFILRDFFPIWKRAFRVFVAGSLPSEKTPRVILQKHINTPGALGERLPSNSLDGRVYLEACGSRWDEVLSHELMEMVINPYLNLEVARLSSDLVQLIPYEICDPVQGTYKYINGFKMSNFVYPNYFKEGATGPFDLLGLVKSPFEILPTGYTTIIEINKGSISKRDIYSQNKKAFVGRLNARVLC